MSLKKTLIKGYIHARRLACRKSKTVLFESFVGASYSDNPRAISEALHKIAPDADIVWALKSPNKSNAPDYVRKISRADTYRYYKEFANASVYVTNVELMDLPKGKNQYYIQTWHGDRAFKKVLWDSDYQEKEVPKEAEKGACDLAIAGSKYGVRQYRSAFLYEGEVLEVGTPRNDKLVNPSADEIGGMKKQLGIDEDVRILLYAPTLRRKAVSEQVEQEVQEIDLLKTVFALEEKYGCKWVCFVRAHIAVSGISGIEYSDKIINVTDVEDMADLLMISDMLITDYSSSAGDFALLGRPIVLFQSDIKQYLERDRDFYFNMEDSPYYIAENQQELENIICKLNEEDVKENCKAILDFYETNETGKAAETIAEIIKDKLKM